MKMTKAIRMVMGTILLAASLAMSATPLDDPTGGLEMNKAFGKIPLFFIENQGQLHEDVAFYVQGSGKTIYFTPNGVAFIGRDYGWIVGGDKEGNNIILLSTTTGGR